MKKKIDGQMTQPAAPVPLPAITSLKEVLAIIERPVLCTFKLDEREVNLKVQRAMPALLEKRRELKRSVNPPYVQERKDYDMLNPQYLAKRDQADLYARALTVYQCCPEIASLKPGLMDAVTIHNTLSAMLPESIMELIEMTALVGGLDVDVGRRANFTSAAPLES